MQWRMLFGFLFVASVVTMFVYSKKYVVEVTIRTPEDVGFDVHGELKVQSYNVKRQVRDDTTAVGMVVGFAIIAGASVIAFAYTLRDKTVP
jgi:hypothetical protein